MDQAIRNQAAELWSIRVEAHHAQSERVMDDALRRGDFWRELATGFRADPHRTDDDVLNFLSTLVDGDSTALDVGGGAGRFAIALALRCKSVAVVDPSPSMLAQLREAATEAACDNVLAVESDWESAQVEAADLVLCSHVVYGVADIRPFIEKLYAHARRTVALVSFVDSPQSGIAPLWEPVHGEPRINLPALPELMNVLWEMDIYPSVQMLRATEPPVFADLESAMAEFTRRLFIGSDTAAALRLGECIKAYLEPVDGGYRVKGARSVRQGVITWEAER